MAKVNIGVYIDGKEIHRLRCIEWPDIYIDLLDALVGWISISMPLLSQGYIAWDYNK